MEHSMSRRTMIAGSASLGLASVLGLMGAQRAYAAEDGEDMAQRIGARMSNGTWDTPHEPVDEALITQTTNCDIVIVGAGASGMPAAMFAASEGANVHVVEKGPDVGVHRICAAGLNSEYAKNFTTNTVDPKEFCRDMYRCTGGFQSKTPLASRYGRDSGKWIDWLTGAMAPYGWRLRPIGMDYTYFNGKSFDEDKVLPSYNGLWWYEDENGDCLLTGKSPNWMQLYKRIALDKGANFHFNEPGIYLEQDGSGRVTGVITKHLPTGEYHRYNASKGVLLVAGDFNNDKEMVHKYAPHLEKCLYSISEPNCTGDGQKMGMWAGAVMDDYSAGDLFTFENIKGDNWVAPQKGEPGYAPIFDAVRGCMWIPAISSKPVLWVDDGGRRFVNEYTQDFQMTGGQQVLATPTGIAYSIWDSAWESKFPVGWQMMGGGLAAYASINTQEEIDREVELGMIQKYNSIEEIAEGCGFTVEDFKEQIERYNHFCETGVDLDCYKPAMWLTKLDTPPYYVAPWGCLVTSTRCGLKIDQHARVISKTGRCIPGLYACGNNAGNFFGLNYTAAFGGPGIGAGQFFSFVAARDMLGMDVMAVEE